MSLVALATAACAGGSALRVSRLTNRRMQETVESSFRGAQRGCTARGPMKRIATPIAPSSTVIAARDLYLKENDLSTRVYSEGWYPIAIGPLSVSVPSPLRAREVTALHDLHHVLTGYGADFVGEFEISAWEVGAGLGAWWPLWLITFPSFLLGWLVCPLRTRRAFVRGRKCRSLFAVNTPYEELLMMRVEQLRERLGIPRSGVADRPARLRSQRSRPAG